ncbi:ester cyclase [Biformimicrobium ophioploci]|uniref:Nuclear transport factor 2 family protein n=1 Tax=Biformimicrobium ophioploci TaxID=3036711 RepID=A0ABQ6M0R9_9GAMM|nr:ester cyclase [Microbulbifer sp. NKW57]GMG87941.1 nuclear transport factor 2 family protein [Microbulbifer sp. NKW57]
MKSLVQEFYCAITRSADAALEQVAGGFFTADARVSVAHPVNDLSGVQDVVESYIRPLLRAFPDLQRKEFVAVPGSYQEGTWVNATGYLLGTFAADLFGIPATNRIAYLRFTEMVRIEGDRIAEYYLILDFLDLMQQAGVNPLRASLGHPGMIMPPSDRTLGMQEGDVESGKVTIDLVLNMLDCLGGYDGRSLQSMALEEYWAPDFIWYGPAGIGTTRGIEGFRRQHQGPFLQGFPNRVVDRKTNILGCGDYASTGGWPHMTATHTGSGWLGLAPTGRTITMRVIDIWRRRGNLLEENWVGIDILHILHQLGLDVFSQMHQLKDRGFDYE